MTETVTKHSFKDKKGENILPLTIVIGVEDPAFWTLNLSDFGCLFLFFFLISCENTAVSNHQLILLVLVSHIAINTWNREMFWVCDAISFLKKLQETEFVAYLCHLHMERHCEASNQSRYFQKEVILCLLFINTNVQSLVCITQNKQIAVKKDRKNLLLQSLSLSY